MKRQITGLHAADRCAADQIPDGVFLARVQRVQFRRQAQKPYYTLTLAILEPSRFADRLLSGRLYCTPKALWKLNWFLRDFGYDADLIGRDEVDEKQLIGLKGVVKISHIVFNALLCCGLTVSLPPTVGKSFLRQIWTIHRWHEMTYSYTQISHYLNCPRRYKYRYLDGWKEKDTRAAMLFGRAFEHALGALFRREDPGAVLFSEWSACQNQGLHYSNGDSWDRMLRQGLMLLNRFCQDNRVQIPQPRRNLQVQFMQSVGDDRNDFVAYIDAIGELDGTRCLLEWKTTSSRYPEEPEGLLSLDPQLVCYSWITGIADVAQIVFVRKRLLEVQYLRTRITDEQREEFGRLVEDTIGRIESAQFLPHSGIRFPQNPCSSCPYVGLCLGKQEMVDAALLRRPGAEDLGWLDELNY